MEHHYIYHVLRMPSADWPDPVMRAFKHLNPKVYIPMQGPSELGASGKLVHWDRFADLHRIRVPTLTIGGRSRYDGSEVHGGDGPRIASGSLPDCPDGAT